MGVSRVSLFTGCIEFCCYCLQNKSSPDREGGHDKWGKCNCEIGGASRNFKAGKRGTTLWVWELF